MLPFVILILTAIIQLMYYLLFGIDSLDFKENYEDYRRNPEITIFFHFSLECQLVNYRKWLQEKRVSCLCGNWKAGINDLSETLAVGPGKKGN